MDYSLKILFGEIEVNEHIWDNKELPELKDSIETYYFENESEKIGFLKGLKEGLGWQTYHIVES